MMNQDQRALYGALRRQLHQQMRPWGQQKMVALDYGLMNHIEATSPTRPSRCCVGPDGRPRMARWLVQYGEYVCMKCGKSNGK